MYRQPLYLFTAAAIVEVLSFYMYEVCFEAESIEQVYHYPIMQSFSPISHVLP
ncbi:MAG: hypothetical protein ACTTH7_05805 [Treponema sp.]